MGAAKQPGNQEQGGKKPREQRKNSREQGAEEIK